MEEIQSEQFNIPFCGALIAHYYAFTCYYYYYAQLV